MSDTNENGDDVFNLERIRQLVELMKEHDLGQVDLRQGAQRIQLKRAGEIVPGTHLVSPAPAAVPYASVPVPEQPVADRDVDADLTLIKSPMVGTFYLKPNPEAESFVKVGDWVSPETTVCIIEAMKVFNEVPAEVSGRIVAVLVENEEPVDFDKPLFKVDTKG